MRAQAGSVGLPVDTGTAAQWPSIFPRYSAVQSILPFCGKLGDEIVHRFETLSLAGHIQLGIVMTSCPERACPWPPMPAMILFSLVLKIRSGDRLFPWPPTPRTICAWPGARSGSGGPRRTPTVCRPRTRHGQRETLPHLRPQRRLSAASAGSRPALAWHPQTADRRKSSHNREIAHLRCQSATVAVEVPRARWDMTDDEKPRRQ